MSNSPKHKDGLARDVAKLKDTGADWWRLMKPEFARVFTVEMVKQPFHVLTNLWVEACRSEPYFFGHVLMIWWVVDIVRAFL